MKAIIISSIIVIYLAIIILTITAIWKIFNKAGKPGWTCIIPIYGTFILLKIVGKPWWWFLLFCVPFVNIIFFIWTINLLSKSFGKNVGFTIGLFLLAPIFFSILAFGNAKYIGPAGEKTPKSKLYNQGVIIGILVGLIIFYLEIESFKLLISIREESTLKTELVDIDTSKVTKIILYPTSEGRAEIKFYKEGKDWKISKGKVTAEPEANAVKSLLAMLQEIKTQRLASREKSKWAEYNLTDTAATRVKVYEGDKTSLDIFIGKFTYQQSNNPYNKMYGGGVTGTTYVRLAGENEIYAVDGFLSFSFNRQFNTFRNQVLARFDKPNVTKISFRYPGDSSFIVTLENKHWMIDNQVADSTKVSEYLNSLAYKNASSFDDNYVPSISPQYQLIVEGKDMKTLTVDAYLRNVNDYILNSNQNSKSWFSSPYKGLYSEVFKNKKDFFRIKRKNDCIYLLISQIKYIYTHKNVS